MVMNKDTAMATRALLIGFVVLLTFTGDAAHVVQAQPYCAQLDDGSKTCGIPSLESCRQTVSGAGGVCIPDETSQMRPDFFGGRGLFGERQAPPPPAAGPQDPSWMPPPPGQ